MSRRTASGAMALIERGPMRSPCHTTVWSRDLACSTLGSSSLQDCVARYFPALHALIKVPDIGIAGPHQCGGGNR